MRVLVAAALILCGLAAVSSATEAEPVLSVSVGGEPRQLSAAELLARPDAVTVKIPADVSYKRAMSYRAVPLLALLGDVEKRFDTIEARATDGFVSQLPLALVRQGGEGGAVAWVAVEDRAQPWPALPGKSVSAGPFYLVWEHPERSGVGSEQWPYQLAALTGAQSPARRWPQMAASDALPADAPARRGQQVFTVQCMPCHRMKGAGAADVGPDLGEPMGPTQYLTERGLRQLIRNPKSVRTWPQQQMPGFDVAKLSDAELDDLIAYLAHMTVSARPDAPDAAPK